jgi:hypothetical protein
LPVTMKSAIAAWAQLQKLGVRWIGRDNRGLLGSEYLSRALEHGKHCLNLLRWERELRTGEHRRVFRDYRLRQARANKSLMDRKHDQRLVSGRRKNAGDQHVGIDNCPDHFALRPVDSFSCRCAAISALISSGVNASGPRRLAPAHAFVSQSGSGAAVRMKSCTLMMTTAGSPRRRQ